MAPNRATHHICMILLVLQITWKRDFLLFVTVPLRTLILVYVLVFLCFIQCLISFFAVDHHFLLYHKVVDTASCNIDKVFPSTYLLIHLSLETFTSIINDRLTYSGGTDRLSEFYQPFKCQPHKMVKCTQTILRFLPTNYLSVFDHFVRLALKGLIFFILI